MSRNSNITMDDLKYELIDTILGHYDRTDKQLIAGLTEELDELSPFSLIERLSRAAYDAGFSESDDRGYSRGYADGYTEGYGVTPDGS